MRRFWIIVVVALLAARGLHAQQAGNPPAGVIPIRPAQAAPVLDPAHSRLDAVLIEWEEHMKRVDTLSAQCTHTVVDKVLKDVQIFEGTAQYMKPDLAMVDLKLKGKPEIIEKFTCTGRFVYQYRPESKVIRVYELPAPKPGQVADDNFLSFLFGMKAEEAKRRYDLALIKEDKWWIYVKILPRSPIDKADFQEARLVLSNQTFLPRELRFKDVNGDENTWDIPKVQSGVRLNRTDFTAPKLPPGWKMERVPPPQNTAPRTDVPPRIIRPKQ
jgi:TIGR03009 family protein